MKQQCTWAVFAAIAFVIGCDSGNADGKTVVVDGKTVVVDGKTNVKVDATGVDVKGPKGQMRQALPPGVVVALEDGALLHSVAGATRVESIKPGTEAETYNLVVADFSTYFVGETGVLVHDNTPRQPTRALVPGLAIK